MSPASARWWLRPPRWSPLVVGLGAALGVLWLWRGLTEREQTQLCDLMCGRLERQLEGRQRVLGNGVSRS